MTKLEKDKGLTMEIGSVENAEKLYRRKMTREQYDAEKHMKYSRNMQGTQKAGQYYAKKKINKRKTIMKHLEEVDELCEQSKTTKFHEAVSRTTKEFHPKSKGCIAKDAKIVGDDIMVWGWNISGSC